MSVRLNNEFHRKLNLARRTGLAGGESGAGNAAKRWRPHHIPRLPKVGMIKEIEELSSKLQANVLGDSCVPND